MHPAVVSKIDNVLIEQIMHQIETLLSDQSICRNLVLYPLTIFRSSRYKDAFQMLRIGRYVGKVVIDWEQEDTIQVRIPQRH